MGVEIPIHEPVLQFTVIAAAALVARLSLERLHLPGLIGLLAVGALLGPGGLHVLPREPVVEFLGAIGLIWLMFIAGLEIDLDVFRTHMRPTAAFGISAFLLSLGPTVAIVWLLLGYEWRSALLLGTLLSSHTLLAYPIIERLGLLHRPSVVVGIGGTLITDTLALVLLAVIMQGTAARGGTWWLPLVLLAALVAVSLWAIPRLSRRFFDQAGPRPAERALYVLVVLLVLASFTEMTGTEQILGAFLAGVCFNRTLHQRDYLLEHLEFVGRLLFIPFFFVSTGMLLELRVFTGQLHVWGLAGLLLALVLVGKASAAWLIGAWQGYPQRDRFLLTGLTLPQAAATLAVTVTARQAGLFEDHVVDAVIILIFITCLAGPLLARWAGKALKEAGEASDGPAPPATPGPRGRVDVGET